MKGLMDILGKSDDKASSLSRAGDDSSSEEDGPDGAAQAGFETAAQDAYHALKTNDEAGFMTALQTAIEMSR